MSYYENSAEKYEPIADQLTEAARTGIVDTASHVRLLMDAADAIRHMKRLLSSADSGVYRMKSAFVAYRAALRFDIPMDDE